MARFFTFKLNGETKLMTLEEAAKYDELHPRIEQIFQSLKNKRMLKDGFEPGWQQNIMEYVGGRREYNQKLKEKGLIELGYDYVPKESIPDYSILGNKEMALATKEIVPELSDNEVDAIASGEYFKDNKPILE